jgi:hypothetical protein
MDNDDSGGLLENLVERINPSDNMGILDQVSGAVVGAISEYVERRNSETR